VKITAIKGFPVKVGHRNQFVVKVETDEGIAGVGEGGISGRELAMQGMLDHLSRFLIGEDPRQIEHHWQTMYRGAYFEGGKILGAVISAIDIALWDILGQSLGVPVYQLLGGACRDRCPCFASPGTLNGPACIERAKELVAQGWRSLRFGPGMPTTNGESDSLVYEPLESLELAAHWIREVRRELGPNVELSIDFHHRLSVAEAAHFCQKIADVNLFFIEEPIRAENPKAYQQLRTMTPIPFAIGEEFSSKWAFAPFIEEGILNFARVDISNVGGLTEAKKVAGWCETHYIDMMPHNPLGPITTAASIHYGIATPNFAALEYQHRLAESYPADLFPTMPAIEADAFPIPTSPGLGVTFNEEAAKEHAFEYWEAPHLRRQDGSYTNW
jgi:galactonate dehydratase